MAKEKKDATEPAEVLVCPTCGKEYTEITVPGYCSGLCYAEA